MEILLHRTKDDEGEISILADYNTTAFEYSNYNVQRQDRCINNDVITEKKRLGPLTAKKKKPAEKKDKASVEKEKVTQTRKISRKKPKLKPKASASSRSKIQGKDSDATATDMEPSQNVDDPTGLETARKYLIATKHEAQFNKARYGHKIDAPSDEFDTDSVQLSDTDLSMQCNTIIHNSANEQLYSTKRRCRIA
jgi:hypothetical protein